MLLQRLLGMADIILLKNMENKEIIMKKVKCLIWTLLVFLFSAFFGMGCASNDAGFAEKNGKKPAAGKLIDADLLGAIGTTFGLHCAGRLAE